MGARAWHRSWRYRLLQVIGDERHGLIIIPDDRWHWCGLLGVINHIALKGKDRHAADPFWGCAEPASTHLPLATLAVHR
jgi:hypothetical protein